MSEDSIEIYNFDEAWESLSHRGVCDTIGGAEYRRVLIEWVSAGQPSDVEAFITWAANRLPSEKTLNDKAIEAEKMWSLHVRVMAKAIEAAHTAFLETHSEGLTYLDIDTSMKSFLNEIAKEFK